MTIKKFSFLVWILIAFAGCAENNLVYHLSENIGEEDLRLLITFSDKSINRHINGNILDGYRSADLYNNSSWSQRIAAEFAERYHLKLVIQWPVSELGLSCVVYQLSNQEQLKQTIKNLENDQDIISVQKMNSFKVLANQADILPEKSDPYLSLQNGYQALGINDLHTISTGRGVRIALIDSGVDIEHPDLQGQIKFTQNLAPESTNHNLADIHGTAVAGILSARTNNGIGIAGIAPEAEVLAFRACWPDIPDTLAAHCNSFTLALALNQAIRLESRIINLSLTGPEDPLLRLLITKAFDKGIIVIASVPDRDQSGGFPANMSGVFAVGRGNNSQYSEITAPGLDILTTVPHQAYDFMTGSSFATPHVAGLTALLLQIHPDWQISDIQIILKGGLNAVTAHIREAATYAKRQGLD